MTARALFMGFVDYNVKDPSMKLADYIQTFEGGAHSKALDLLATLISINSMDETVLYYDNDGSLEGSDQVPKVVQIKVSLLNSLEKENSLGSRPLVK
jgi:hypothetical protein